MNGEELYWCYVQANSEQGVGVDAWGDLSVDEQRVWDSMARKVWEMME